MPAAAASPPPAPGVKPPFPTRPGSNVVNEFKKWVAETGRPDLWRHHNATPPPRDQDFEELTRFDIPEKLRPEVGRATCPICSPSAPKYFYGALAWFEGEGVLRAIGHECAKAHFGVLRANAAVAKRKHRERVEGAEYYLLEKLPLVAALRAEVDASVPVGRIIDMARSAVWDRATKAGCHSLARLGQQGLLSIEDTREVHAVDEFGKGTTRRSSEVVAVFKVAGLAFLTRSFSVEALARNTGISLHTIRAVDEGAALQFVVDEFHGKDEYLFQAKTLTEAAMRGVDDLRAAIAEAHAFFAPANLKALNEWSRDHRSGAPITVSFDPRFPARVQIGRPGRASRFLTLPPELLSHSGSGVATTKNDGFEGRR